MNNLQSV